MTYVVAFLFWLGAGALGPHVTQQGWEWFVVPLGAPSITYWQAMGISVLFFMKYSHKALTEQQAEDRQTEREKETRMLSRAIGLFVAVLIQWGVMALAHGLGT